MEESINYRVKKLRTKLALSQVDFCNKLLIKQGTLSDIERGRISVSHKTVDKIAEGFNVSKEWLYTGNGYIFNNVSDNEKYDTDAVAANYISPELDIAPGARIKVVSFWKKLLDQDKEISKTLTALSELESLKADLELYIKRLNTVVNQIDIEVSESDNKTITSEPYIKKSIEKLGFLKQHYKNIHELNKSIESVLVFVDHDARATVVG